MKDGDEYNQMDSTPRKRKQSNIDMSFDKIIEGVKDSVDGSYSKDSSEWDLDKEIEDIKNRRYFIVPK